MSSRALRKLQREREFQELQKQQKKIIEDNQQGSEDESDSTTNPNTKSSKPFNAFDLLNRDEELEEEPDSAEREESGSGESDKGISANKLRDQTQEPQKKSKKKKKSKGKGKAKDTEGKAAAPNSTRNNQLDEIDRALRDLRLKAGKDRNVFSEQTPLDEDTKRLYSLLAVDTKNLNAINEMKKLFGSAVLNAENDDAPGVVPGRRRGRGLQQVDLGGALAGRNSPASRGQGLAGLSLRKNVFMAGKEEWPKATSGGLGMEVVEKAWDGTTEYRFVHHQVYQDVQRQFESCVESMDPQRMISLLQFNPYHISTLLQVSEIAKQQGDHSVSGDLLERALFSFGRSTHSSFHTALAQGTARLDFRRPENREFWLTVWRYIINLGQRGTWRTSYEWAKLLLSLDPEGDPYCIGLIIDQLALRGGQAEHFLNLAGTEFYQSNWAHQCLNVQISKGLGEYQLKRKAECRQSLSVAIKKFPWTFFRLFRELNLDHIPKAIWGVEPRNSREDFESKAYVTRAKDLWNTPEAISLLVEVAESVQVTYPSRPQDSPLSADEARHVIVSDIPALLSFIPREYIDMRMSASDPLPPPDSFDSYTNVPDADDQDMNEVRYLGALGRPPTEVQRQISGFRDLFARLVPWTRREGNAQDPERDPSEAVDLSSLTDDELMERAERLLELERRAEQLHDTQPGQLEGNTDTTNDAAFARALFEGQFGPDGNAPTSEDAEENGGSDDDELPALEDVNPSSMNTQNARAVSNDDNDDMFFRVSTLQPTVEEDQDDAESARAGPSASHTATAGPAKEPYDDEHNQRWLAGQGLMRLRDFTTAHGTDEKAWQGTISDTDPGPVEEYVRRVKQLQRSTMRDFIVNYRLQQGAGDEVRDLVKRLLKA